MNFGEHIKQLREQNQLLQRQLANALEVDSAMLSKIERGERRAKREHIPILASLLKTNEKELFTIWLADQVYEIIKELNIEITKELGEPLMTGLLTDTGGFSHQDVLPSTFAMAEDLSKIVNISLLYDKALRTITINQFNIKKIALDNLEFYYNGKVAISYITEEDMINTGVDQNDCGILVNIPLEIEGIEVSIFLRKYKEEIRVSLRSKHINVNEIVKVFGGGGHINAAGVTVKMPYEEIKKQVLEEVGKRINEWSISSK